MSVSKPRRHATAVRILARDDDVSCLMPRLGATDTWDAERKPRSLCSAACHCHNSSHFSIVRTYIAYLVSHFVETFRVRLFEAYPRLDHRAQLATTDMGVNDEHSTQHRIRQEGPRAVNCRLIQLRFRLRLHIGYSYGTRERETCALKVSAPVLAPMHLWMMLKATIIYDRA